MGKYKKLGKNIAFITIGNFSSKILSFFLIPFYTAILTTEEYGLSDLMTTTINLLMPFLTLLMCEALMRFTLDKENDPKAIFTTGMSVVAVGMIVFLLFSPLISLKPGLKEYYWYFVALYCLSTLHTELAYFVRGIEKVGIYSSSGVIQTIVHIAFNILFLAVWGLGIKGYLLAAIIGNLVSIIYLFLGARLYRFCHTKAFDRILLKKMLQYSVPMIPNSLSWWISNSSDKYLITFFCGVAATGVYSVSQRIPSLFATISSIFMGAWTISAVEDFGSEKSRAFYSDIYRKYSVFNIVLVSLIVLLTKPIARFLFANEFFAGWYYVPVLVFAFLFHATSSFLGSIYTSAKKTKVLFVSTLSAALANIILNAILIPILGVIGAAVATLISYMLIWLIRIVDSRKIMKLDWNKKNDIVSYLLLLCQVIMTMADLKWISSIGSGMICVLLLIVNVHELKSVLVSLRRLLAKKATS